MKSAGLAILFLVVLVLRVPAAFACEFKYDPVLAAQYYRASGWNLPGTKNFNSSARLETYSLAPAESIPGAVAQALPNDKSPNVVEFPAQEFVLHGARQKMRATQVQVGILRWVMHGRIVAYSYSLIPVVAHRGDGKWIIDSMAACVFFASFIDDKGDGVFRVLVPDRFAADLVPLWAKPREN
jgi:hypothetical protein